MTESSVQVAPDSSGKLIATVVVARIDGSVVHRQEFSLADGEYDFRVKVTPTGELLINDLTVRDLLYYIAQQLDCIRRATNRMAETEYFPQDVVVS